MLREEEDEEKLEDIPEMGDAVAPLAQVEDIPLKIFK